MFKRLYNKFKKWFVNKFYVIEITPKGEYFYKYLSKIVHEEWTEADYNQYYEDILEELLKEHVITRIEAATLYYRYFKDMKKVADSYK